MISKTTTNNNKQQQQRSYASGNLLCMKRKVVCVSSCLRLYPRFCMPKETLDNSAIPQYQTLSPTASSTLHTAYRLLLLLTVTVFGFCNHPSYLIEYTIHQAKIIVPTNNTTASTTAASTAAAATTKPWYIHFSCGERSNNAGLQNSTPIILILKLCMLYCSRDLL